MNQVHHQSQIETIPDSILRCSELQDSTLVEENLKEARDQSRLTKTYKSTSVGATLKMKKSKGTTSVLQQSKAHSTEQILRKIY